MSWKVFGPLNGERWLSINQLRSYIKTLPTNSNKFPSLPLQEIPKEGFFFEELSDLFYVSKKGGKNYRNALKTVKKGQKINIEAEKSRFGCKDTDSDDILDARRALHWHELGNEILDTNLRLFYGKTKFAAQLSNFVGGNSYCTSCKAKYGTTVDETFLHGCYNCPNVNKYYRRVVEIFGFREVDTKGYLCMEEILQTGK